MKVTFCKRAAYRCVGLDKTSEKRTNAEVKVKYPADVK